MDTIDTDIINLTLISNPSREEDGSYSDLEKLMDDVVNQEQHELPVFFLTSFILQCYFPIRAHFIYAQFGDTFVLKSKNTYPLFEKKFFTNFY